MCLVPGNPLIWQFVIAHRLQTEAESACASLQHALYVHMKWSAASLVSTSFTCRCYAAGRLQWKHAMATAAAVSGLAICMTGRTSVLVCALTACRSSVHTSRMHLRSFASSRSYSPHSIILLIPELASVLESVAIVRCKTWQACGFMARPCCLCLSFNLKEVLTSQSPCACWHCC